MPRVSVIIPAYNAEEHIADAISSVLCQTYSDWEVVVGDDASTDRTREIANRSEPRVRVIPNSANAGPASARNLAISHSSGELLAFLDADDYWLPEYLEHQVRLYDASRSPTRDVGIVACNARILGPFGFSPATYLDVIDGVGDVTVSRLLRSNPIFVSAISPHNVVLEAGGFCPAIRGTEDHDLWLRIVELGYRAVCSREPLVVYRVRGDSVSSSAAGMARATQLVYLRALERGNLTARQRRTARRELRLQRAVERVATPTGVSYRRMLASLPLLVLVALEHPRRWRSFTRIAMNRGQPFARFEG